MWLTCLQLAGNPSTTKRVHAFSGLIGARTAAPRCANRGREYICLNYQRSICSRSVNEKEITTLIEEAVLSVFSRIALAPEQLPSRTAEADGERQALGEGLQSDREAWSVSMIDHYDGIIRPGDLDATTREAG